MIVTIPARQALLDTQLFTANEVNALSDSEVSMALSMLRGGVPLSVVRGYLNIEALRETEITDGHEVGESYELNKKSKKKTGKTTKK